LPVVLHGCETWSLASREELRLRVFENRLQRRIFGPNRHEITGDWRRLRNEELHDNVKGKAVTLQFRRVPRS